MKVRVFRRHLVSVSLKIRLQIRQVLHGVICFAVSPLPPPPPLSLSSAECVLQ